MEAFLLNAIVLNNEGAQLVKEGFMVDAVVVLRRAVSVLQTLPIAPMVVRLPQNPYHVEDHNDWAFLPTAATAPLTASAPISHENLVSSPLQQRPSNKSNGDDAPYYVYNRPVFLPLDVKPVSLEDYVYAVHVATTCAIFNTAIALHSWAIQTGSSVALVRAMDLYQTVLATHGFDRNTDCKVAVMDVKMTNAIFQSIVLNNLSHIHRELCEYHSSYFCLDCIVEIFARSGCLNNFGASSSSFNCVLTEREADEIKLNVVFRHCPTVAEAA